MTSKFSFGIDIGFYDVWRLVCRLHSLLRCRRLRLSFKDRCAISGILLLFYLIRSIRERYLRSSQKAYDTRLYLRGSQTPEQDLAAESNDEDNTTANPSCATTCQSPSIQRGNMLHSPMHLHEVEENSYIDSVSDIARKMHGVAMFIKNEYCTGLQATIMPTRKILGELVDRLLNYGWPLVSADTGDKLDLPGDKNIEGREAVEAMEYLARFCEQRIGHMKAPDLSKDLTFAARYTEALLHVLPADGAAATHVESVDDAATSSGQASSSIERSAPEEGHHEPLLTLKMLESDAGRSFSPSIERRGEVDQEPTEQSPRMQPPSGAKDLSFKGPHVVENVPWQPALATVDEDALSTISSLHLDSPPAISVSDNEELRRYQAPVGESKVPDIPRELQGRRLSSRTWFESDPQFSELIGKIKQWRDSNPDYDFTTIRGGPTHARDDNSHFCRAVALGISALADIKCEHPLDPAVVRHLDIDVLRFVRLALWDWTNGRAERKAERESLEIVRKEIRVRKEEMAAKTSSSEVKPRAESAVSGDGSPWELLFDNEELDSRYAPAPNVQRKRLRQSFQTADTIIDPEDSDVDLAFAWLDANHDPADDDLSSIKFEPMLQDPETVKAIKVASSSDSDNFSTLLERSTRAAPGISTGPTASLESMPSKLLPLVQTQRLARLEWENEILRQKVAELQGGLAELQEELESLTPLDMPPIGSRTDSLQAHPLQYLVGQRLQPSSSSMQAEVDSTSDDALDEDDDLKRYTRDDMVSMLEFLKTEPPPVSRNVADDRSKEKWSHALLSRIRGPARASRRRPSLYDGDDRPSHACVPSKVPPTRAPPMKDPPTRALRSSRARGRAHIPEKEVSSREPPLHSGYIWPQPAGMSMKEV